MVLTIKSQFLIALAWGPRRATRNTRYGVVERLYPRQVSAHYRMWFRWFRSGIWAHLTRNVAIVIPTVHAGQKARTAKQAITLSEGRVAVDNTHRIKELSAKRQSMRESGQFEEADLLRDEIISLGGSVSDGKIG